MNESEFSQLMKEVGDLAASYPDGMAYIGGIAVYLHTINYEQTREYAEFTHDADFYISVADMGDLRHAEEVTPNRRLSKSQIIKNGFEFDIYTERLSSLVVPFDQVMAQAIMYESIRVACLEHLLVLKIEAYKDRKGSSKGQKDAKDIIRLSEISLNIGFDPSIIEDYIREDEVAVLESIGKSQEFMAMAKGNAMVSKKLRTQFQAFITAIKENKKINKPGVSANKP